jgi:hypothetical protein
MGMVCMLETELFGLLASCYSLLLHQKSTSTCNYIRSATGTSQNCPSHHMLPPQFQPQPAGPEVNPCGLPQLRRRPACGLHPVKPRQLQAIRPIIERWQLSRDKHSQTSRYIFQSHPRKQQEPTPRSTPPPTELTNAAPHHRIIASSHWTLPGPRLRILTQYHLPCLQPPPPK